MNKEISLSVIFPAFNEEKNIENTLLNSIDYMNSRFKDFEIIVVDDGSTDGTSILVKKYTDKYHNIILKTHDRNYGYGQALKTGFDNANKQFIFIMDSDGQFNISDFDQFIDHVSDSSIIIGYRYNRADPRIRKINMFLYHLYLRTVFGLQVKDIDCAFKIFPRDAYLKIRPVQSEGAFFSAEFLIKFKKAGYTFIEIPVNHYPRKYGNQTGANITVILKMFVESYKVLLK